MSQRRENPKEKNFSGYNVTFGILSALAILMIVAGHAGYDILTVGGLFPYYSFHVPLFLFISGYFYRQEEEAHPLAYLKKEGETAPCTLLCLECGLRGDLVGAQGVWRFFDGRGALLKNAVSFSVSERLSVYL